MVSSRHHIRSGGEHKQGKTAYITYTYAQQTGWQSHPFSEQTRDADPRKLESWVRHGLGFALRCFSAAMQHSNTANTYSRPVVESRKGAVRGLLAAARFPAPL